MASWRRNAALSSGLSVSISVTIGPYDPVSTRRQCSVERYAAYASRSAVRIATACSPNSSCRPSSVPHRQGPGEAPGPPLKSANMPSISPTRLSGRQLASAIRPPCRHTRSSSSAVLRWSAANIAPNVEATTSKRCSA